MSLSTKIIRDGNSSFFYVRLIFTVVRLTIYAVCSLWMDSAFSAHHYFYV